MFEIKLSSSSAKFLKRSEEILKSRIFEKIKNLSLNPFPSDSKRIVGEKEKVFRARVGDYRILYVVFIEQNILLISDIDKRSRVY